jgi:hypothetical protein
MAGMMTYCMHCRKKTGNMDIKFVTTKNGKDMMKSVCTVCGSKKSAFVSGKEEKKSKPERQKKRGQKGRGGIVDKFISALPFEAHLPVTFHPEPYQDGDRSVKGLKPGTIKKAEYLGPGTNYDLRYERGDRGLNNLDHAAMFHDLAYKSKDPASRNRADHVLAERANDYLKQPGISRLDIADAGIVMAAMKLIHRKK